LVDEHVWNDLIKDVDQDGNGEVDYEEFKLMMTKLMEGEIAKNLSHQSTRSSPP
jgi:Ca2+-binding EF-hand superfamily protein